MYKEMYYHLFNIITDALEEKDIYLLKEILRQGQIQTETMYIESGCTDNIIELSQKLIFRTDNRHR